MFRAALTDSEFTEQPWMMIQIADLMRAVDDLETIKRKVFETMEPLWDEDERMMRRALATLHAIIREANQS